MKHKDYYDDSYIDMISEKLAKSQKQFNASLFKRLLKGQLDQLALFERLDLIVDAMEESMPPNYTHNIEQLFNLLEKELEHDSGMFNEGWWYWPISRYVERNGILNFGLSMRFLKELTKRFTGEYAVRPLIKQYPNEAVLILIKWSKDENVHVRRLASEGIRTRLPWSKKLDVALEEFDSYFIILDNLKNDSSKFVQKSVGNNLNDLFKDDPDKASFIISKWERESPTSATKWIISHGKRNLNKIPKVV